VQELPPFKYNEINGTVQHGKAITLGLPLQFMQWTALGLLW